MAQLVLGIGMSHSTMVTLDDSLWGEWAAQDSALAILFDTEGQAVTYAQLAERAGDRYAQQATVLATSFGTSRTSTAFTYDTRSTILLSTGRSRVPPGCRLRHV